MQKTVITAEGEQLVECSPEEIETILADRAAFAAVPTSTIVDGLTFLDRLTDQEYEAITNAAGDNAQLRRWIDMLRLRGGIDVAGGPAVAAKAVLVQAGLLTAERADTIFAGP